MSRTRVAFVSPSGLGNLGDAAIIDSLVAGIRQRLPDAEIVGFTLNPADTSVRHGVEAYTCGAFSLPHYGVRTVALPEAAQASDQAQGPLRRSVLRRTVAAIPGARGAWALARKLASEGKHRRAVAGRIRGFDLVAVAGGGQLDDFWGGPFGHPYTLWKWSHVARSAGARFAVLSVGTGSLDRRLSRWLVHRALAGAGYRSYRDERSRELVQAPSLTAVDAIVPDLAYALPLEALAHEPARMDRRVIAVGPMCYSDPRVWPVPDEPRYRRHIGTMAAIAVRAIRDGHEVRLFVTDRPDRDALVDARVAIQAQLSPSECERLHVPTITAVAELMSILADADVIVAARFHAVLLGHAVGRPVLAVSHERKVTTLMAEMGHERFCAPIDELDPELARARLAEILEHHAQLCQSIAQVAATYRHRVEQQYDRVFGRREPCL